MTFTFTVTTFVHFSKLAIHKVYHSTPMRFHPQYAYPIFEYELQKGLHLLMFAIIHLLDWSYTS